MIDYVKFLMPVLAGLIFVALMLLAVAYVQAANDRTALYRRRWIECACRGQDNVENCKQFMFEGSR